MLVGTTSTDFLTSIHQFENQDKRIFAIPLPLPFTAVTPLLDSFSHKIFLDVSEQVSTVDQMTFS
jgi:hypothetical protein